MFNIEEELKKLPKKPGVYLMKDKDDKIIYVGKAVNLKNRVSSYFRKTNKTDRILKMVSLIDHFEYIVVAAVIAVPSFSDFGYTVHARTRVHIDHAFFFFRKLFAEIRQERLGPYTGSFGVVAIVREPVIVVDGVSICSQHYLPAVANAIRLLSPLPRTLQCRQQHRRQNRDDGNNDQQFNQGKVHFTLPMGRGIPFTAQTGVFCRHSVQYEIFDFHSFLLG